MGAHFPAVELGNAIRFSTLSRMPGFLWHSSKWACRFGCFLQYMPGLEVLAVAATQTLTMPHYYAPTVPLLEPLSKVATIFRGEHAATFQVYSHR